MFQNWQKTAYQTSSNRSKTMKIDRFDDVLYAVFSRFETKIMGFFVKCVAYKKVDFTWIQIDPQKVFFLYATPLRKINKSFVSKLAKYCIPNIIKSIKNYENLIDLMMCGIQIFANFDTRRFFIFLNSIGDQKVDFTWLENGLQKTHSRNITLCMIQLQSVYFNYKNNYIRKKKYEK